jgi:hypothetical protein
MSTYVETVWCCTTGKGSQLCIVDKNHDELKSLGRFWYQEIRDFLIRRQTVPFSPLSFLVLLVDDSEYSNFTGTLLVLLVYDSEYSDFTGQKPI